MGIRIPGIYSYIRVLKTDIGKRMLSSPPASPLPRFSRNQFRVERLTMTAFRVNACRHTFAMQASCNYCIQQVSRRRACNMPLLHALGNAQRRASKHMHFFIHRFIYVHETASSYHPNLPIQEMCRKAGFIPLFPGFVGLASIIFSSSLFIFVEFAKAPPATLIAAFTLTASVNCANIRSCLA